MNVFGFGTEKPLGVAGAGGACLSALSAGETARARAARASAVRILMILLLSLRPALGLGLGLGLGLDDENRSILGTQVLLRGLLDQGRSHLSELRLELIDAR